MSYVKQTTRDLAMAGLMLAAGLVLHFVCPAIVAGMRPDFSLIMLILFVLLRRERKITIAAGIATGIITAMTTTFPGGQIANVIDKVLTTFLLLGFSMLPEGYFNTIVTSIVGTIFSGTVFLTSAFLIVGLPTTFKALFISVVLPAAALNTIAIVLLYPLAIKLNNSLSPQKSGVRL